MYVSTKHYKLITAKIMFATIVCRRAANSVTFHNRVHRRCLFSSVTALDNLITSVIFLRTMIEKCVIMFFIPFYRIIKYVSLKRNLLFPICNDISFSSFILFQIMIRPRDLIVTLPHMLMVISLIPSMNKHSYCEQFCSVSECNK